jgi:3-deoxy-D-manno-octulosonic-acid transferase
VSSRFFYEHATVVFVGKSLTAHGGQNPIEPGAWGKAMVLGPNMENFEGDRDGVSRARVVRGSNAGRRGTGAGN